MRSPAGKAVRRSAALPALLLIVATVAVGLAGFASASASASDFLPCGHAPGTGHDIKQLRQKGTTCHVARTLAHRFDHDPGGNLLRFHCRQTSGGNAGPVRCGRNGGRQVVKFTQFGLL